MFLHLLALTLCDDTDYYCFGTSIRCQEFIKTREWDNTTNFQIFDDISNINNYIAKFNPNVNILFPDAHIDSITINFSRTKIETIHIYGDASGQNSRLKIILSKDFTKITLNKINAEFIIAIDNALTIYSLELISSFLSLNSDFYCKNLKIDKSSRIIGEYEVSVSNTAIVEYNTDISRIKLINSAECHHAIPSYTNFVEIMETKVNLYASKDSSAIMSLDIVEGRPFHFLSDDRKTVEVYMGNSALLGSQCKKISIRAHNIDIRFTGKFPKSDYSLFDVKARQIIVNTSHVPLQADHQNILLQTNDYNLTSREAKLKSHQDYNEKLISVYDKENLHPKIYSNNIKIVEIDEKISEADTLAKQIFICFYEKKAEQCEASIRYDISEFNERILNIQEDDIKIEIHAETKSASSVFVSGFLNALQNKSIELFSTNSFKIDTNIDNETEYNISSLTLVNITLSIDGEYDYDFYIDHVSLIESNLESRDFSKYITCDTLDTDVPSITNFFIKEHCNIQYSDYKRSYVTLVLIEDGATVTLNGAGKSTNVLTYNHKHEGINYGTISLNGIFRINFSASFKEPRVVVNDLTDDDKTVDISTKYNTYTGILELNMKGKCDLVQEDPSKSCQMKIKVAMRGKIKKMRYIHSISTTGPIELIDYTSGHPNVDLIVVAHNLTIDSVSEEFEVKNLTIVDGFVNLINIQTLLSVDRIYILKENNDVYPVTFVTNGYVANNLYISNSNYIEFNKIQIKCIAETAPQSKLWTKSVIIYDFVIRPNRQRKLSIMLLYDKKFLGFWSGSNSLRLEYYDTSIVLRAVGFSEEKLLLCFTEPCEKGYVVTSQNIADFIPPNHKNIDITVPSNSQTTINLENYAYSNKRVHIHSNDINNVAQITLKNYNFNNLELDLIKAEELACSAGEKFNIVLNRCQISGFTGVKDSHHLTVDFEDFKSISTYFKRVTLRKLENELALVYNEDSLAIAETNIIAYDISIEYKQTTGKLSLNLPSADKQIKYSFSLNVLSNVNIDLAGEWHKIKSLSFTIDHDLHTLGMVSTTAYSDPFIIKGDGQVTKSYKTRSKKIICACEGTCNCPPQGTTKSFAAAITEIEQINEESSTLDLHIFGSTAENPLTLDISSVNIPEITFTSLVPGTKQISNIKFNTFYDKLTFANIDVESTTDILKVREVTIANTLIKVKSIQAGKASLDTISIGIDVLSVVNFVSIQSGFSKVFYNLGNISFSGGSNILIVAYESQTEFDLTFDSIDEELLLSDAEQIDDSPFMKINVKSESNIKLETSFPASIISEKNTTFNINKNFVGTIECLTEAYFQFYKDVTYIETKLIVSGCTKFLQNGYHGRLNVVRINEIIIKGTAKVKAVSVDLLILGKVTIEDENRIDFPFVFPNQYSIDEMGDIKKATMIRLENFKYIEWTGIYYPFLKMISFNSPKSLLFTIIYEFDKPYHGFRNEESIYKVHNEPDTVYLVWNNLTISEIPAEVCIYDADDSVCGKISYKVKSTENLDSSLFPKEMDYMTIKLYTKKYTTNDFYSFQKGIKFDTIGLPDKSELILENCIGRIDNFNQINFHNLILSDGLYFTMSNVDLTSTTFKVYPDNFELENSNVTLDFATIASRIGYYNCNFTKIINIPNYISIRDANTKYPYVQNPIRSKYYEWYGSNEKSKIEFRYEDYFEKAEMESKYFLNADTTIIVNYYRSKEFKTNMKFITNGHNVILKGIDFIPKNLFSDVTDVILSDEPEYPSDHGPVPTPKPTPIIIVVDPNTDTVKPTKPGLIQLVASGSDGNPDYGSLLQVNHVEIQPNMEVGADNLIIKESLSIKGNSILKPLFHKPILIPDGVIDIKFESVNEKLPSLDLGFVGVNYNNKPKSFVIKMDLSSTDERVLDNEFKSGKVIVSGTTLNCEDWMEIIDLSQITGMKNFKFSLECPDSYSRILNYGPRDLVLRAYHDGSDDSLSIIIAAAVAVVVIIIIIVIIVVVCKCRKRKRESSSSNLNSSGSGKMNAEL